MIHFAWHVDRDRGWRFDGGHVEPEALRRLGAGRGPDLVFVNACGTPDARAWTTASGAGRVLGARHVVLTTVALPDRPGADFAARFYRALLAGEPVGEALRRARVASAAAGDPVWAAYSLLGDPGVPYFARAPLRTTVTGVRSGVVIAVRTPVPEATADEMASSLLGRRARFSRIVDEVGGRVLQGTAELDRAVFGVPISYETMVARISELDRIETCAARVIATGRPVAITIVGAAGIGKTRLLRAACARLEGTFRVVRGDRDGLARAYNNLGALYGERADYGRAAAYLRESIRIRARCGHASLAVGYANLGECELELGALDEARTHLERAAALCAEGRGPGYLMPDVGRMLAALELKQGDAEAAIGRAHAAIALASTLGDPRRVAVGRRTLVEALAADGRVDDAERELEASVAALATLEVPHDLAAAPLALARLVATRDPARAAALRDDAHGLLEAVGSARK